MFLSEEALDEQTVREAINAAGYEAMAVSSALCRKNRFPDLF